MMQNFIQQFGNWQHYWPWIQKAWLAIAIFAAFYILAITLKALIKKISHTALMEQHVVIGLLANTSKIITIILGAVTALGTIGVNVSALVASLGLTGFGLSFAFQDILSSALSGVMLLLYRPFQLGDHIAIDKYAGKVVKIDLRYIHLLNEDDAQRILVPNTLAFKGSMKVSQHGHG